jgi:hypothetical protein
MSSSLPCLFLSLGLSSSCFYLFLCPSFCLALHFLGLPGLVRSSFAFILSSLCLAFVFYELCLCLVFVLAVYLSLASRTSALLATSKGMTLVLSCLVLSCLVSSCLVSSRVVLSRFVSCCLVSSCLLLACHVFSRLVL